MKTPRTVFDANARAPGDALRLPETLAAELAAACIAVRSAALQLRRSLLRFQTRAVHAHATPSAGAVQDGRLSSSLAGNTGRLAAQATLASVRRPRQARTAATQLAMPATPLMVRALRARRPVDAPAPRTEHLHLGWTPALALLSTSALMLIVYAYNAAREGAPWAAYPFWFGVVLLAAPIAFRLCSHGASDTERLSLVLLLGMGLYLVKLLHDPIMFTGYDELQHVRTAQDILRTGHLFNENSLLPISPLYPGLEIATSAISTLCGLPLFVSGVIVVGAARVLMLLALFLLFTRITDSARFGGLAAMVYITNTGFVFFDSQFAYESLALPFACFVFFIAYRRRTRSQRDAALLNAAFLLAAAALVITHHLTTYMLFGYFVLWTGTIFARRLFGRREHSPIRMTLVIAGLAVGWLLLIASLTVNYLSSDALSGVLEIIKVMMRSESGRVPFQSYSGEYTAPIERYLSLGALALSLGAVMLSLPLLLWRHRGSGIILVMASATLAYPAALAFHLTKKGDDIAGRTPEFVYLAVGIVVALGVLHFFLDLPPRPFWSLSAAAGVALLLVGGMITGWGPSSRIMPGGWVVEGDARSIDREGLVAAAWSKTALGPNNHFATDRIGRVLFGTLGEQRVITLIQDRIDVSDAYFAPIFGPHDSGLLAAGEVTYLEVDRRMSQGLPVFGVYFEATEPGGLAHTSPIPLGSLQKFDHVAGVSKLFDAGDISIYDVRALDGQ